MSSRTLLLLACLLTLLTLPALGDTNAREVEEDNSLASSLVTPHKAWAKNHAGGPIRALFFVYTGPYDGTWEDTGTRVREVVELGQRFDLQADAVLFCGSGEKWAFHGQKLGEQRAERLLEKPYQLYVIAGFPMERLPAKIQYLILKQVSEGGGLMCCGPPAKDFMVPKRQIDPTPATLLQGLPVLGGKQPADLLVAYRLAKGRGVWLKGARSVAPAPEFSFRGLAEYDYWMLLAGRAALWAAGKEGLLACASVLGGKPLSLRREDGGGQGEVTLANSGAQAVQATVALELCRACDGQRTSLGEASADIPAAGTASVPVALPRLRAGDYYLDAIVRTGRGVEACGAGVLTVTSDAGIEAVKLSRTFVERGEIMDGTVTVRGVPPADSLLRIRFRDSYDRILKQQDVALDALRTEYPFECPTDEFSTILMRVEALLISGGEEVEMKDAFFTVPKRRQDQFNFVMWDAPNDILGYYAQQQVLQAGYNVCLIGSFTDRPQPAVLRALDTSLAPYSTRILDPKDDKGYMQPVCWNDEPAVTEYVQKIVDNQKRLREQGVFVYSLGDEGVTLGCCVHPACIAAYRKWLESQYGTIEALNASWGTEYKSFDEVDLLSHADNMETRALKTCFPRWYDRQAFARYNLMQFSGRFVEAYRRLDPLSKTGFEGTGGFTDDFDLICGINDFYGPYPSIGDDILRSVAPPELVNSNWMGYSKTGDALSDAAWRMVMKQKNSIWYWMWSGIGNWRGYLRPTLDFWPAIEDLTEEMRPVKQGLGDLLMRSPVAHSGIAVFYSVPSALSSQLENSGQFASCESAHQTWTQLTYDLGLDFRYLTSKLLTGGALSNEEFKVLLLPMTHAVSPTEAEAIRRFVEQGGTVIADVRPAVYDGHCKPATPGLLDDLFGIKRTGRGKVLEKPVVANLSLGGRDLALALPSGRVDADVQAAGAEAQGMVEQAPVLLVNRVAKGQTILLNFALMVGKAQDPSTVGARRLLSFLYDAAGVQGPIRVSSPAGEPLPLTETRIWRTGDALVFGLWRQMENAWFSPKTGTIGGAPVAARIALPTPRHVYDLRAGKYLGEVTSVDTSLRWGRANFFLALPYRLGALRLSLDPETPAPGDTITASVSLRVPAGAKEQFATWVQVTDPRGNSPLWGQQVVLLQNGRGKLRLHTALNDLPGTWTIKATELFSGQSAQATWRVPG